jgi:TonB family protein
MSTRTIDPPVSASTPVRKPGETHRSHPVAIEIPVTVQGSRSAPGHQLPQQFVEETRTVLVFVEGGVLRISEEVAPGQFLILKNLCTNEEAPCVVVPKNIGSAKGYVEVEFAQPADGFWGVDFSTGQANAAAVSPLMPGPAALVPSKPVAPEKVSPAHPAAPEAAPPSEGDAELMKRALDAAFSSLPHPSPKPSAEPAKPRDEAAHASDSAPALKTAGPGVAAPHPVATPTAKGPNGSYSGGGVSQKSSSGSNSLAIPQVAVPLAIADSIEHNAAVLPEKKTPAHSGSSTAPAVLSVAQTRKLNPLFDLSVASRPGRAAEPAVLASDLAPQKDVHRVAPNSGWKWMLAGVVVALACMGIGAGSYRWFFKKPLSFGFAARTTAPQPSTTPPIIPVNPAEVASTAATSPTSPPAKSAEVPASPAPLDSSASRHAGAASTVTAVGATNGTATHDPANETPRHQSILARSGAPAAPVATPARSNSASAPDAVGDIAGAPTNLQSNALGSILPGGTEANSVPAPPPAPAPVTPAAPSSVLQQAHLLKSAPPIYPQIAAERGDGGEVKIDALVNEAGKVTETKVLSGPMSLRIAAMTAVRQWVYQPAKLDGKAISTHVIVTVKFELKR